MSFTDSYFIFTIRLHIFYLSYFYLIVGINVLTELNIPTIACYALFIVISSRLFLRAHFQFSASVVNIYGSVTSFLLYEFSSRPISADA